MARKLLRFVSWAAVAAVALYVILAVYIGLHVYRNDKRKADAIIVLGARSFIGNQYNPCLTARVEEGVNLLKKDYAGKIIFTGGNDREDGKNEAGTMEEIALKMGVQPLDILLETKSSSTYENLLYSRALMQQNNLRSAIIVTEPFHSPRASLVASKLGINHTMAPALTSPCWARWTFFSRFFLREPVAVAYYFVKDRLQFD